MSTIEFGNLLRYTSVQTSVVKAEIAARPPHKLMRCGSGVRSGRYFVARTLIYLILKYHIVQKEILKYLKH